MILNSGYGYDYVSKVFYCNIKNILTVRNNLIKLGHDVKDPKEGGIQIKDVKRVGFVKVFNDPENAQQAMQMIRDGYSYGDISQVLRCDRSSVINFHQNMMKRGIMPPLIKGTRRKITQKIIRKPETSVDPFIKKNINYDLDEEKKNKGQFYECYLKKYKKESSLIQKKQMEKARKVIDEVHRRRAELGIVFIESSHIF